MYNCKSEKINCRIRETVRVYIKEENGEYGEVEGQIIDIVDRLHEDVFGEEFYLFDVEILLSEYQTITIRDDFRESLNRKYEFSKIG